MSDALTRDGFDFQPYGDGSMGGAGRYTPTPEQLQKAALDLAMRTRMADDLIGTKAALVAGAYLDLLRQNAPDPRRAFMEPSIMMASGRYFNFEDPEGFDWNIDDIAHSLSLQNRFTGHTRCFYSTAEHSVRASHLVPPGFELEALLHDAHEFAYGDMSTPLKILCPEYRRLEDRGERAMRKAFGLPEKMSPEVKVADLRMLATEKRDVMPDSNQNWGILEGVEPAPAMIQGWVPEVAKAMFIHRYNLLTRFAA